MNDPRQVCPFGWHTPSSAEWNELQVSVAGDGGKLKNTGTKYWVDPNSKATNSTGFSAIPNGFRSSLDNSFKDIGKTAYFWTSSEGDLNMIGTEKSAVGMSVSYFYPNDWNPPLVKIDYSKSFGFSIRCVKNK